MWSLKGPLSVTANLTVFYELVEYTYFKIFTKFMYITQSAKKLGLY